MFSFLPSFFIFSEKSKLAKPEEAMADYIVRNNKKAIELLYLSLADDLYHYLLTLSDPTLAKDIAQKTWLKVIEKPHNYHTAGSVKAWLFTLARNALLDEFRKTKPLLALNELDENNEAFVNNTEQTDNNQESIALNIQQSKNIQESFDQALMQLALEQREAFCLQQEGFSLADIANITNTKQETVKTRLRYAKSKLRQLLEHANE